MPPSTIDPRSAPGSAFPPPANSEFGAWLIAELPNRLAEVFETMAGERPRIDSEALPDAPVEAGLAWRQTFRDVRGTLWIFATEPDWSCAGQQVLRAAGMEDGDVGTVRSTFLETIGQALSGFAQSLSGKLQREVTPEAGAESPLTSASGTSWVGLRLAFASATSVIAIGFEPAFVEALAAEELSARTGSLAMTAQAGAETGNRPPIASGASSIGAPPGSKTFELLLDVELPVSVSFGRAQIPLKDVLKLTTGSIVELNRSISEPVEIIVNNCVIARGEVVVVEGNFGVRIQQVVSRQERLRTLT